MNLIQCEATIQRSTDGDMRTPIRIILMDRATGTQVAQLRMGLSEFSSALFGRAGVPCSLELSEQT